MENNNITIIIPCFNEGHFIEYTIKKLISIGLNKILVIDDCSSDNTQKIAVKAGAEVIRNPNFLGFNMSVLRGLYHCQTKDALVYSLTDENIEINQNIVDLIDFARMGNYAMFVTNASPDYSRNLSKLLKKKFGLFLPEPGFEVVFLNSEIVQIIKNKVSASNINIFFDVIKEVIRNNLKIGVYPIYSSRPKPIWVSTSLPKLSIRIRLRRFLRRRKVDSLSFFEYAFPDLEKRHLLSQALIAFVGYVSIRAFEALVRLF